MEKNITLGTSADINFVVNSISNGSKSEPDEQYQEFAAKRQTTHRMAAKLLFHHHGKGSEHEADPPPHRHSVYIRAGHPACRHQPRIKSRFLGQFRLLPASVQKEFSIRKGA